MILLLAQGTETRWHQGIGSDLRLPPSHRLKALRGDRKGQYSIRINDQWRICFRWTDRGAREIEVTDYH